MTDFEVKRTDDGQFILLNQNEEIIDGVVVKDTGEPVSVWATARTDEGQAFYVRLPVTREILKHDPNLVEERLRMFAEHWERGLKERAENVKSANAV